MVNVYLDHAASAPVREEALAAWARAASLVGNPSSVHADGRAARRVVEDARERIAAAVGARADEVVLTSGGTESVNLAVKGLWGAAGGGVLLTTGVEHHATLDAARALRHLGARALTLPVDVHGRVRVDALADAVREAGADRVAALSLSWANSEIGTVEDVAAVEALVAATGIPLHWDAVAAVGRLPVDFGASAATALSLAGHKFGAPVGTGALLVRRGTRLTPLVDGGGQQEARSGTLDAAGAAALAAALEAAVAELGEEAVRLRGLVDRLVTGLAETVPGIAFTGHPEHRIPGHVHATIPGVLGETLLFVLDRAGYSVSVGSACRAGVAEPSHVLLALGADEATARSTLRVTLGRTTTPADVAGLLAVMPEAVATARAAS